MLSFPWPSPAAGAYPGQSACMPSLSMYEPMRSINMSMRLLPQNNSPLKTMGRHAEHTERFRFIDDAVVLRTRRPRTRAGLV